MSYKFIGTKQDLIDNGFNIERYPKTSRKEIAGKWYATRDIGVYCKDQQENETIIIFEDYTELSFNGGWMDLYIDDYIQDLIDKGLVVQVDE